MNHFFFKFSDHRCNVLISMQTPQRKPVLPVCERPPGIPASSRGSNLSLGMSG